MTGQPEIRGRQRARAGRDAFVAGRDQVFADQVVLAGAGAAELAVPGLLPRDVPAFTGREEELVRLASLARGGSVVVTAISGTAGVGKTALAVHAAHRLLDEFPDGHLYADLRGYTAGQDPAGPGEVLQVFLRRLGVPADEVPAGTEERSGLLRQLLASQRVMVVLDNARTEAQVRPLLPGAGASLVLVTSRSVLPGLEADARISLDVLPPEEAAAMLAEVIGAARAAADPEALAEVAGLCGRLPLALRIAGQLLASHPAWPVARLARMLAGERDRLEQLSAGDLQVRAAFAVSYQQLADGDAPMFRLLGLHPGPDFDAPSAASLAGIDPEAAELVLHRLVLAHLIIEEASGRFALHDLLRLFARRTCQETDDQETRDAAQARLVRHYAEVARFLDSCLDPRQRPAVAQAAEQAGRSLPTPREALAIFETERPSLLAALGVAAERGWDEQAWQLSESMGNGLRRLRYLDDLLTVEEAALAAARHAGDTAAKGRALNNLGMAYQQLRRSKEAITCHQDALVIFRETRDRHSEGEALGNLGSAYQELRRFEEAITCHQDALVIFRETGDRHGEGQALGNLGIAYGGLRRLKETITCYQDALVIFRETGDRHGEGQALGNLGVAYGGLRRFEEATTCFQQDIAICRETGDRHGEGQALGNLGRAYQELRRLKKAITCYQDALVIFRETGDRHGEGEALGSLGSAYGGLRRLKEAITCYQDALVIFRETGDRHGEGQVLGSLGSTYEQLRRLKEAITCYQDALVIFRETGDRHSEGLALGSLGSAYQGLRRLKEAITCYQDALVIFRETGDRHSEGQVLGNLGSAYHQLEQPDRAAAFGRDAAAAMRDAGDHEEAARLEQLAASAQSPPRRRWGLRRRPSS